MGGGERLKYEDLSDEEVERLILERLREIKELLVEIKRMFEEVSP